MDEVEIFNLNRKAFSVASLLDHSDEKDYWLSKSPGERLEAIETMRQIIYGHDATTSRLQRVLTITQQESN